MYIPLLHITYSHINYFVFDFIFPTLHHLDITSWIYYHLFLSTEIYYELTHNLLFYLTTVKLNGIITSLNLSTNLSLIITYNMYALPFLTDQWRLHYSYHLTFNKLNKNYVYIITFFCLYIFFSCLNAGLYLSAVIFRCFMTFTIFVLLFKCSSLHFPTTLVFVILVYWFFYLFQLVCSLFQLCHEFCELFSVWLHLITDVNIDQNVA